MQYRGIINDIIEIESANKGTPGLQFDMELTYKKNGDDWVPIDSMKRSVWLYFPDGDKPREITLKKLAVIGWSGGPIEQSGLIGKEVTVESRIENYQGEDKEKFDFPMPDRVGGQRSEQAKMKIDQILSAAPVPDVGDQEEKQLQSAPAESPAPQTVPDASIDEGDDLF